VNWQITHSDVTLTNSISQEISMTKRSFFLTAAAGLLASTVLAAPSRAGSELLTVSFALTPTGVTATDLAVLLSGAVPVSGYSIPNAATVLPGATANGSVTDTVTINFPASSKTNGTLDIYFTTTGPVSLTGSQVFSGVTPANTLTGTGLQINLYSVPEPSSMALLGIGMTGFLAFRRLFKRNSVA
jgi:PEP-CTERM motif